MDLFLLFIIISSLIGITIYFKKFNKDYLSIENTTCIKGIFILFVFFSHAMQYISVNHWYDSGMLYLRNHLNQLIVVMFLFYSGYGIYESFKKKKENYVSSMPKNRILKTLFHFDIAVLCFIIVDLFLSVQLGAKRIILSLIGWESVGNSNWYIFVTLILYIITYVSLKAFKDKKAIYSIWIQSFLLILFLYIHKEGWWYNTILCFPLGISYSYHKDEIEKYTCKNNFSYIISILTALIATYVFTILAHKNIWYYELWSISFTLLVVLATMKVNLKSPILNWFGKNLFWVFILQRIPMMILAYYKYQNHPYRFFAISFIGTIILSYIFSIIFNRIDKVLFKKRIN